MCLPLWNVCLSFMLILKFGIFKNYCIVVILYIIWIKIFSQICVFLPTLWLAYWLSCVLWWSFILSHFFILWLLLSVSCTIGLHATSITRLWVPRGKEYKYFYLVSQSPAESLTHEYRTKASGGREEDICILLPVWYLFGESSPTITIQSCWYRFKSSAFPNPSLGMCTWLKTGQSNFVQHSCKK